MGIYGKKKHARNFFMGLSAIEWVGGQHGCLCTGGYTSTHPQRGERDCGHNPDANSNCHDR